MKIYLIVAFLMLASLNESKTPRLTYMALGFQSVFTISLTEASRATGDLRIVRYNAHHRLIDWRQAVEGTITAGRFRGLVGKARCSGSVGSRDLVLQCRRGTSDFRLVMRAATPAEIAREIARVKAVPLNLR